MLQTIIAMLSGMVLVSVVVWLIGLFLYNRKLNLEFMENDEIEAEKVTFTCSELDF